MRRALLVAAIACLDVGCIFADEAEDDAAVASSESPLVGATTATLTPARDATLIEALPTKNDGLSTTVRVDGDDPGGTGKDLATLLAFDLASIPSGAMVKSVTLTLDVTNASGATSTLYELKRAWVEKETTWSAAANGAAWQTRGAAGANDRGTIALGTVNASVTGAKTITLNAEGVATVQRWVASPSSNHGFIVVGTGSDGLAWSSREQATTSRRPRLAVGYDPPSTTTDGGTAVDSGSPPPAGTSYYVDDVAGNDAADGKTTTAAWRSLAKASAAPLAPGDRLLFRRGGTWTGSLSLARSGTASAAIAIGAWGAGALPVIAGGSTCVKMDGSYVTVENLRAHDCGWAGFAIAGSHDELRDGEATGSAAGVYIKSGAVANRVLRNRIVDNKKMSVLTEGGDDDSGAFGVALHGDGNEIAWNIISGHDAFSYDYGRDGAAVEIYGGQDNHIHHNLAEDNDAFTELGHSRSARNVFAYNVVRSSLATSVFLVTRGAGSSYGPVADTRVFNNTVHLTGSNSQGFVCHAGCGPTILTMRNNIIQAVWKVGYADATFDEDYDLFYQGQMQFARGPHTIVAAPGFVSPSTGDLHLLASSPAIDSAVGGLGYTVDHDGNAVPRDGNGDGVIAVDRGAYER